MIFEYRVSQNQGLMLETHLKSNPLPVYAIGSTSFKLNTFNLPPATLNRFISVGYFGSDTNELLEVLSNAANVLTTTPSQKAHKANEPVFVTEIYKARIYGAITEGGAYTLVGDSILYDFSEWTIKFNLPSTTGWFKVVLVGKNSGIDVEVGQLSESVAFQIQDNSRAFWYTTENDVTALFPQELVGKVPSAVVIKCIKDAESEYNAYVGNLGCTVPLDKMSPNYGLVSGMVEDKARCCMMRYAKCDCTQEQSRLDYKTEQLILGKLFICSGFNVGYSFKCSSAQKLCGCSGGGYCEDCQVIRRVY